MRRNLLIFFNVFLFTFFLYAKSPPESPFLRIDNEMHTAKSRMISIDKNERYILTASNDKTAKLWEASTGELVRTFRIPIDEGNEGKVYSAAISPDARRVILGGWTAYEWEGLNSLYVFDTFTGKMIKRIKNFGNAIFDLEFSNNGEYLAVCMAANAGVKILDTKSWSIRKELKGYKEASYSASFSNDNNLVTASFDGKIRLYNKNFLLIKEKTVYGGKNPFEVEFSPDGKKIALGYSDTTKVEVYDSSTLDKLYSANTADIEKDTFMNTVGWSYDGEYLYAGGGYIKFMEDKWWYVIRKYEEQGKGNYVDLIGGGDTIMDIKRIKDGIIFCSYNPDFGRIDDYGERQIYRRSNILAFKDKKVMEYFKIGENIYDIGFKAYGKDPHYFSLEAREIIEGEIIGDEPKTSLDDIEVTDWYTSYQPKINGVSVNFLDKYEMNRCAAIADNGTILFGTEWNIYAVDRYGTVLWKKYIPDTVWAVNTRGNYVVVSYGDGTIRWHRLDNGDEIAAIFMDEDMKKWIMWTPSGFYDASAGGANMAGWHINNGIEKEADFYPLSRFSERYYRPEIVMETLKYADENTAVAENNKKKSTKIVNKSIKEYLPPVVTILSPDTGSTVTQKFITLELDIKTPEDSPVTELKILINGRPSESGKRGIKITPKEKNNIIEKIKIEVENGENEISVIAKNKNGFSEAPTIRVYYEEYQNENENREFIIKPTLYVLAIGIADYKNKEYSLKYPSKDAEDFVKVMKKQKGKLYKDVDVKLITNDEASKDSILDALEWLEKEVTSKDVAMIFMAGHGINDNNGNLYYMAFDSEVDKLKRTALPATEVTKTISNISGKVLYFMDTCHSGNIRADLRRGFDIDLNGIINELSSAEVGTVVFCSSTGRQYSLENEEWNNGAFTKALLEGLEGAADYQKNGIISINELDLYVSERVKKLTKGKQTPVTSKPDTIRDFPIIAE